MSSGGLKLTSLFTRMLARLKFEARL